MPSPAFKTAQFTFWASKSTAPELGCRTTNKSGRIAFKESAVSISVSPFLIDEACIAIFITSAPSRLPAISKLDWVRVEFSKEHIDLRQTFQNIAVGAPAAVCFGIGVCQIQECRDFRGVEMFDAQKMRCAK